MKIELRQGEIEFAAETPFERRVLETLHDYDEVTIKRGKTTDPDWPPDPKLTNIVLVLPDDESNDPGDR